VHFSNQTARFWFPNHYVICLFNLGSIWQRHSYVVSKIHITWSIGQFNTGPVNRIKFVLILWIAPPMQRCKKSSGLAKKSQASLENFRTAYFFSIPLTETELRVWPPVIQQLENYFNKLIKQVTIKLFHIFLIFVNICSWNFILKFSLN
jgi:hypothetical protein